MQSFDQLIDSYNEIKNKLQRISLKEKELRELGCLPAKGNNEGMPRTNGPSSPVEGFVYALCELEEKRKALEKDLFSVGSQISTQIDLIPNYTTQRIIEHKVCFGGSWKKIARTVCFSESRVRQLYKEGISFLKQKEQEGFDSEVGENDFNAV